MDTDEEYLDDLLEAMTNNGQQNRTMKDAMRDVKKISDEVKQITRAADIPEMKSDTVSNDSDDWKASLDDILAQADRQDDVPETGDSLQLNSQPVEEVGLDENLSDLLDMDFEALDLEPANTTDADIIDVDSIDKILMDTNTNNPMGAETMNTLNMENMDVTDLLDNMDGADADLAEINGMLNKADKNEDVNDDILELLESVKADSSEDSDESAFDIFDEHELKEVLRDGNGYANAGVEPENTPEKKSKKKKRPKKEKNKKEKAEKEGGKKKKLFGRKTKAEDTDVDAEEEEPLTPPAEPAETEEQSDIDTDSLSSDDFRQELVGKKPGLFAKLKEMLTEEIDEFEEGQDAAEGLKEIDDSQREEIKKEAQKKKKAEKEEKKEKKKNKKEKPEKKKKVKKEKEPKNEVHEKPILSRKVLILLVALCATLLASIFILSNLLPEYEQRQKVRAAYQDKDYETVYKFLYNKKRNNNESVMYDRADLVLKLERKWKSYQNHMLLNQELEALHALMQGVDYYHSLSGADYEAQAELDVLYQQICAVLGNYGITPEDAVEINAYDEVTYTKKLTSVVSGTDFDAPGEEKAPEEPAAPQDMLPEEEEIIGFDSDN